jgi:hypothetical protein
VVPYKHPSYRIGFLLEAPAWFAWLPPARRPPDVI